MPFRDVAEGRRRGKNEGALIGECLVRGEFGSGILPLRPHQRTYQEVAN
jgi:hypothetical protein